MTISKTGNPVAASTNGRPPPVRVKLQRINAGLAKAHPPDGNGKAKRVLEFCERDADAILRGGTSSKRIGMTAALRGDLPPGAAPVVQNPRAGALTMRTK